MLKRLASLLLLPLSLLLSSASSAQALNSIYLSATAPEIPVGNDFQVQLLMDFDDVTSGGGIEISFDPSSLSFKSFQFDSLFSANFGLTGPADAASMQPLEIGFGFFVPVAPFGAVGQHTIGTLTFTAVGVATAQQIHAGPSVLLPGPFYGPSSTSPLPVEFGSVGVNVVVVPEPTCALLIGCGLGLLARRGRTRVRSDAAAA